MISVVRDFEMYDCLVRNNPYNKNAEFIVFDNNKENQGISARYNSFLDNYDYSNAAWFVFCHEDWEIKEDLAERLKDLDKSCLYGPIGAPFSKNKILWNSAAFGQIEQSKKDGSRHMKVGRCNKNLPEVGTFDCQCLIVHSSLIKEHHLRFDENLYFDLYIEDFCINAREKYNIPSKVLQLKCHHWSNGKVGEHFYEKLDYLRDKYREVRNFYISVVDHSKITKGNCFVDSMILTGKAFNILRFIFQAKRTKSNKLIIKIFRVPVFSKRLKKNEENSNVNIRSFFFKKLRDDDRKKVIYKLFRFPVFSVSEINEGKKYKVLCFVFRIKERLKQTLNVKALSKEDKTVNLFFDMSLGGGTNSYFENYKEESIKQINIVRIQYVYARKHYQMSFYSQNVKLNAYAEDINRFDDLLRQLTVKKIIISSLISYPNPFETLNFIKTKFPNKRIAYMGHDYFSICPYYTLMRNGRYCGCPESEECEQCFTTHEQGNFYQNCYACHYDIKEWRQKWGEFLGTNTDEVIVFSQSGKDIFSRVYPQIRDKIEVITHKVPYLRKCHIPQHQNVNIVVLGSVPEDSKGMHLLNSMEELIAQRENINLSVVGSYEKINPKTVVTGIYEREDLPEIMEELEADIVFIPSVCPETFSYTTSEAMLMGLAVACFNVGAQEERVKKYDKGLVISEINAQVALDEMLDFIKEKEMSYV